MEIIARSKNKGQQPIIILRDVAKAFDKVWHMGLKFKLLRLNLPLHYEKLLCNYLDGRQAQININTFLGPNIPLLSGVPQGGCLSPTLYFIYTSHLPPPIPNTEDVQFADDITQIIMSPSKSKDVTINITKRAILAMNEYERKWKIKTNIRKFKVIPLSKVIYPELVIDGDCDCGDGSSGAFSCMVAVTSTLTTFTLLLSPWWWW